MFDEEQCRKLSHRGSTILNRVEVGDYFADHLTDPIFAAFARSHLVEFLSPHRHLVTPMGARRIATVDEFGYTMRRQRHAIFVAEHAQVCRRRGEALRDRTIAETFRPVA